MGGKRSESRSAGAEVLVRVPPLFDPRIPCREGTVAKPRTIRVQIQPNWGATTYGEFADPAFKSLEQKLASEWKALRSRRAVGRPSIKHDVWAACRDIWMEWNEAFPPKMTIRRFVTEVSKRLGREHGDTVRTAEYVRDWIRLNLYYDQYPRSLLQGRHGKAFAGLIRSQQLAARILERGRHKDLEVLLRSLRLISSPASLAQGIPLTTVTRKKSIRRSSV